jgi:hypothetical protein
MVKKKVLPEVPPIEEAAAPNASDAQQSKQKKRRKKTPLTHKKKSKYPPIPKPKKRGRPKMLVRKPSAHPFDGGRAPRKIYAGGEVLYGDERYCMRCSEQLNEDEGDKVQPWLDPHVCSVCRKKGGDADRIEWRLLNGGLFDECVRERDESGALSRVESARVTMTAFKTYRSNDELYDAFRFLRKCQPLLHAQLF